MKLFILFLVFGVLDAENLFSSPPVWGDQQNESSFEEDSQIDKLFKRILSNTRVQNLSLQNYARFLIQLGMSEDLLDEIQMNVAKQKPIWQLAVYEVFPQPSIEKFREGFRFHSVSDVSNHLRSAQQMRKTINWDVDLVGAWIIQYVEKHCNRNKFDLPALRRDLLGLMRIIPENYRGDFDIETLLQQLESSMVYQAILKIAHQRISNTQAKWFKSAQPKTVLIEDKKPPKAAQDPWVIQTFDKQTFDGIKDSKLIDLWRNLQGTSGGFDVVSRSISSEIENLSREDIGMPLYQKNIMAFLRGLSQQFQEKVQKAPLGVAAWLYDKIEPSVRQMWEAGPHFQPYAFQQWRGGDKASIDTLSVDGIQLALLGGLRDIEAKTVNRQQKVAEIQRFIEGWKQRFQNMPHIADMLQALDSATSDVLDKMSPWLLLAQITENSMTPKGYQALLKEFPKARQPSLAQGWDKVSKIKHRLILPWGKESSEHTNKSSSSNQPHNPLNQFVSQFTQSSESQSQGQTSFFGSNSNKFASQKNSEDAPSQALQKGIQQFMSAFLNQ